MCKRSEQTPHQGRYVEGKQACEKMLIKGYRLNDQEAPLHTQQNV